jgi:hypothetical protein
MTHAEIAWSYRAFAHCILRNETMEHREQDLKLDKGHSRAAAEIIYATERRDIFHGLSSYYTMKNPSRTARYALMNLDAILSTVSWGVDTRLKAMNA